MSQALAKFQTQVVDQTAKITQFREELGEDPSHALKWGNSAFEAAARLSVAKMLVYCFTDRPGQPAQSVESVRKMLLGKVTQRSKYPPQSTSPTSNLMEQYELAALAEAYEELAYLG